MPKKGKCTNIFCREDGKVVPLDPNNTCPACGHPQTEVQSGSSLARTLLLAALAIAAVVAVWSRIAPKSGQPELPKVSVPVAETPQHRQVPRRAAAVLPAGTRVPGSTRCQDCEAFYWVADGKGGKVRKSDGYTTECCKCGSRVAFSDGYYYDIVCQEGRISAKMGDPVKQ